MDEAGQIIVEGAENAVGVAVPGEVRLTKVLNERQSYDPPTSHLGQPFGPASPLAVAEALTAYLSGKLKEAEAFVLAEAPPSSAT